MVIGITTPFTPWYLHWRSTRDICIVLEFEFEQTTKSQFPSSFSLVHSTLLVLKITVEAVSSLTHRSRAHHCGYVPEMLV